MRVELLFAGACLFRLSTPQLTLSADLSGLPINISGLPACAQSCLAGNTGAADGCAITDIHCLCSSITYINALSCCLAKSCSSLDQEAALRFDISLCLQYNVKIPDFIGCSPLGNGSAVTYPSLVPTQLNSFVSVVASAAAATSTVTATVDAYETTEGGLTATYTGSALMTGTCTDPVVAVYTPSISRGAVRSFPWLGCDASRPGCCPFDPSSPGSLAACPPDYITTSSGCCPSGWSLYTTALFSSQTPCYSAATPLFVAPSAPASSGSGDKPTVLTDELFSLHYELAARSPGLSGGSIAGIVVGCLVSIGALAGVVFFIWRRREALLRQASSANGSPEPAAATPIDTKENFLRLSKTEETSSLSAAGKASAPFAGGTPTTPGTTGSMPVSELPSPAVSPLGGEISWRSGSAGLSHISPGPMALPGPLVEMAGSTFIHEHHPAFLSNLDLVAVSEVTACTAPTDATAERR